MNANTAVAIINVAVIILIGVSIYVTKNTGCLVGLIFLMHTETKEKELEKEEKQD